MTLVVTWPSSSMHGTNTPTATWSLSSMPYADEDDQMLAILHVEIVTIIHTRMDLKSLID
jgi:hypothetical protein